MIQIMCCSECMHSLNIKNRKVIDEHKISEDYYCPICEETRATLVTYLD